ncbi:MAG TPA: peptide-methionine (S)-S-oxide reductase MsrA [Thermoanaerobaculia bacterium]|jgi:peptide-methionine (S)-S-oxide reductase
MFIQDFRLAAIALLAAVAIAGASPAPPPTLAKATFAGGCFWCMEPAFETLPGVVSVTSGYTGGTKANPTYEEISSGGTGHAESVEVAYDPSRITYERLLEAFWHNIDPLSANGQFCDRGNQYRSAIFFHDERERHLAEESKRNVGQRLHATVVTQIVPAGVFYPAEEYHQDFYKKNSLRYREYRAGCGRDARLKALWGAEAGHAEEKP